MILLDTVMKHSTQFGVHPRSPYDLSTTKRVSVEPPGAFNLCLCSRYVIIGQNMADTCIFLYKIDEDVSFKSVISPLPPGPTIPFEPDYSSYPVASITNRTCMMKLCVSEVVGHRSRHPKMAPSQPFCIRKSPKSMISGNSSGSEPQLLPQNLS